MPARWETIDKVEGETRYGSRRPGIQGGLYAYSNTPVRGSYLALDGIDVAGAITTHFFFVTAAGVLRVSSTLPTNTETDGAPV